MLIQIQDLKRKNYLDTLQIQEDLRNQVLQNDKENHLVLVEHDNVYTMGNNANSSNVLNKNCEIIQTQRGGDVTYHGPGQRVVYVMLDLNKRGKDIKKFIENLEAWIIQTLAEFNVVGQCRSGRVGIWVERPDHPKDVDGLLKEEKIAAIGVRLRKWRTLHGLSINVDPNLEHFQGIVPCGIKEHGVTSLVDLGLPVSMTDLDIALKKTFSKAF